MKFVLLERPIVHKMSQKLSTFKTTLASTTTFYASVLITFINSEYAADLKEIYVVRTKFIYMIIQLCFN